MIHGGAKHDIEAQLQAVRALIRLLSLCTHKNLNRQNPTWWASFCSYHDKYRVLSLIARTPPAISFFDVNELTTLL